MTPQDEELLLELSARLPTEPTLVEFLDTLGELVGKYYPEERAEND